MLLVELAIEVVAAMLDLLASGFLHWILRSRWALLIFCVVVIAGLALLLSML